MPVVGQSWFLRLRNRYGHLRTDADLEAEMQAHAEMEIEDRVARGNPEQFAGRMALAQLGNPRVAIERIRDQELVTHFEGWLRDIVLGLRTIRSNRVFSATAILTLALGVGANSAIFSLLYGLTLRSLPTEAPSQIVQLGIASRAVRGSEADLGLSNSMLTFLRRRLTSLSAMAAWSTFESVTQDRQGSLRTYQSALVSGEAFKVVSLHPTLGRLLGPEDDTPNSATGWPVAISYGFWNERFGRDPYVVGKRMKISGADAIVVGVMPKEFNGVWPGVHIKLYLPLQFLNIILNRDVLNNPDALFGFAVLGRLQPGVSISQADAELRGFQNTLLTQFVPSSVLQQDFIKQAYTGVNPAARGLPIFLEDEYANPLYVMQAMVALVLLLCCINVGGLLLSRVYRRQREFALRSALGARPPRLVRQYLTESVLLALGGSALGALFAWRGAAIITYFFRDPSMGEAMEVSSDHAALWLSAALTLLTTLLCGVVPAWRAGRAEPAALLQSRTTLGSRRHIAGKAFVPIQVAFSLVLMVLAILSSESVWKMRSENTGFDAAHVTIQTSRIDSLHLPPEGRLNLYSRIVARLREMPQVRSAAVTFKTPMTGKEDFQFFEPRDGSSVKRRVALAFNDVGPGYFETMRIPILAGREFTRNEQTLDSCILSRSAATLLFGRKAAVGLSVRAINLRDYPAGTECRVVGIAGDAKFSDVHQGAPATIYFPLSLQRMQAGIGNLVFLIRSEDKSQAISAFKRVLAEKAPNVPLAAFVTLREQVDAAMGSEELMTLLCNFLALITVLLSALGLYGLLSAIVAQRTSALAMRIALGARAQEVMKMIMREAMSLVIAGLVLGFLGLAFVRNTITPMLHGITAFDPMTLVSVTLILLAVSLVATLVPALRAVSIDPAKSLRIDY